MSRGERKAVERIRAASERLLAASNHAEEYVGRVELTNAIRGLLDLSAAALAKAGSRPPSPVS